MRANHKTWWTVKGRITARFGTIAACAAQLGCSASGIQKAVAGECPGIATKLKRQIGDWEASPKGVTA